VRSALPSDASLPARVQDIERMLRQYAREQDVTFGEAFDEAMRRVRELEDDQGGIEFSE